MYVYMRFGSEHSPTQIRRTYLFLYGLGGHRVGPWCGKLRGAICIPVFSHPPESGRYCL